MPIEGDLDLNIKVNPPPVNIKVRWPKLGVRRHESKS